MSDETPLRADAQKNRMRILSAAEELFLKKGAAVPLEEVAKTAGVGIGTLYRRFPPVRRSSPQPAMNASCRWLKTAGSETQR